MEFHRDLVILSVKHVLSRVISENVALRRVLLRGPDGEGEIQGIEECPATGGSGQVLAARCRLAPGSFAADAAHQHGIQNDVRLLQQGHHRGQARYAGHP